VIAVDAGLPSTPPLVTPDGLVRVAFRSMATNVEVLLPAGRDLASSAVVATFVDWERCCSRFDPDSELSRLNARAGGPVVVSRRLFDTVAAALSAARATDGIFDPTVLHRLEDLGYDRTFAAIRADGVDTGTHPASPTPWAGAWRSVRLDRPTRSVDLPAGTGLDLGGIAKGMAVDAALGALVDQGIRVAAVNAGGDLAVHGIPPGADAWWIAVETSDGGEPVAVRRGALATSSTARRRWTRGGRTLHHLVDPRTGLPSTSGLVSVTAAANACAQAEVAAKVALVLGPTDGADFLSQAGISALAIGEDGSRHRLGHWLEPDRPAVRGEAATV
jgi:thiamine biosynthesis lipoprotein